jgi:cytochrome c oxidase subunit III
MGIIILLLAGLGVIAAWWLSRQRLMAKPWLEEGVAGEFPGTEASTMPAAKIGLGVFLAVVGALFALFMSAYVMRMGVADWRSVPKPTVLWFSTGVLILSSAALQWAQEAGDRRDLSGVRTGLLAAGATALAFLAGQLLAWRALNADGYFLASNPASTFFYLLTAVHGLHLLGGLVAMARTALRARGDVDIGRLRLSLELCAMYWHFLLLVWLVLFALLFIT